jgi:hypothetical protein
MEAEGVVQERFSQRDAVRAAIFARFPSALVSQTDEMLWLRSSYTE